MIKINIIILIKLTILTKLTILIIMNLINSFKINNFIFEAFYE